MNIPNAITTFRIVLIPVFIAAFYLPYDGASVLAAFIFWFAAITDWFDGYLARKLNQQSSLGAFIDPLADKLMVISALLIILAKYPENNWLLLFVAVSFFGKAKTVAQMFALLFLIYGQDIFGLPTYTFGVGLLVWAAILTMVSMAVYIKSAWHTLSTSS